MTRRTQVGILVLALLGLGLLFFVGVNVFLRQDTVAVLTEFELYAIAFTFGVWSTLTVGFVLNYVSVARTDDQAIGIDPRL